MLSFGRAMRNAPPKSRAFQLIEPALNYKAIPKFGRAAIVDLGVDNHRVPLRLSHFCKGEPEFFGEQCTRYLDEAQIRDVRHDAAAVGIEEHHLHFCANT